MSAQILPVDVSGLRVVVTGAGSGIGKVTAVSFLERGARVFISDVSAAAVEETLEEYPALHGTVTDVSDEEQVERMFEAVDRDLGGIDVLINNAGVPGPTAGIADVTAAEVEATLAVNVKSQFYCSARAVSRMQMTGGSIINLSSVAGRLSFPKRTPYAAAKWAVVGFTKSLAMEVGRSNIRVNAIMPGHVNGPRLQSVWGRKAAQKGITTEQMLGEVLDKTAMGKTVEMQDIANTALFLASPFGAAISGQSISVCGGVEMMG